MIMLAKKLQRNKYKLHRSHTTSSKNLSTESLSGTESLPWHLIWQKQVKTLKFFVPIKIKIRNVKNWNFLLFHSSLSQLLFNNKWNKELHLPTQNIKSFLNLNQDFGYTKYQIQHLRNLLGTNWQRLFTCIYVRRQGEGKKHSNKLGIINGSVWVCTLT